MVLPLTMMLVLNALVTSVSGTKKKARCVSLLTVSASLIALALSTMLMVDMKAWKVASILPAVRCSSRCRCFARWESPWASPDPPRRRPSALACERRWSTEFRV